MSAYPPQPWNLAGTAYVSLWWVPVAELPRVPQGITPARIAGHAPICTARVDYRPPGQLAYHELLSAVAVHNGQRGSACITEIWVDSPASLAGGRDLWAIPKEPATLDFHRDGGLTAVDGVSGSWIATARFVARNSLALRVPARFRVSQSAEEGVRHSPVRLTARPAAAAANWRINPDGPLGHLAGRTPAVSAILEGFEMRFGCHPAEHR